MFVLYEDFWGLSGSSAAGNGSRICRLRAIEFHHGVGAVTEGLGLGLAATAQAVGFTSVDIPLIFPGEGLAVFAHDLGLAYQGNRSSHQVWSAGSNGYLLILFWHSTLPGCVFRATLGGAQPTALLGVLSRCYREL